MKCWGIIIILLSYDVFKLLQTVDSGVNIKDVSVLDFYNHQQFIINVNVQLNVFAIKKEELKGGDNIVNHWKI